MAKPSYPRARRLAETMRRLAGEWLEAEQADQPGPLVTVTDVRVSEDLHHASVYFTVLGDDRQQADAEAWLATSAPRARSFMASQLRLRHAPTVDFVADTVPGQGARIDRLLAELGAPPEGSGEPRDGPAGSRSGPSPAAGSGEPQGGAPVDQAPEGSDQEGSGA
jgi:ribosome-binding factor A